MTSITLLGRTFKLSPLTLGDLRRLEPALLGLEQKAESGFASMLSLVPVIHASISKLHPELALEELEEMLDLSSFSHVLDRVLEASGLKRQSSEAPKPRGSEAGSAGESGPGGEQAGSPTGRISTAPSQRPPAGPFPK
jgi:hypothetical protein